MARVAVLIAIAAAAATAAFAATPPPPRSATGACSTSTFTVSFDPKRRVVVTDGAGHTLASASFTTASIGRRCRRVARPKGFVTGGLGSEIRRAITFRCLASKPIRVHVNPIRNRDTGTLRGSSLTIGVAAGTRLRTIVSAVLQNKGDPYASRVYRASAYCKLGA